MKATAGRCGGTVHKTGQLSSVAYPKGVEHNYTTYNTRDRLTNLTVSGGTGRTASYGYDTIYRLLNETISGNPASGGQANLFETGDRTEITLAPTTRTHAIEFCILGVYSVPTADLKNMDLSGALGIVGLGGCFPV